MHICTIRSSISIFVFCIISFSTLAQVGINTTEPRTTLEVAGDANINGSINVDNIGVVINGDDAFLLTQTQTNLIKELNTTEAGNALAYFQEYELKNVARDWVKDFNTNLDASKYAMIVISAFFNRELRMDGTPENFAIPAVSAVIDTNTNTWRLRADYPSATTYGFNSDGNWTIKTIIITKNISKEFSLQTVLMNGSTTKQAVNPIIN